MVGIYIFSLVKVKHVLIELKDMEIMGAKDNGQIW